MTESIAVSAVDLEAGSGGVSEQIYQNVRRAIILGDLPSGTRLSETRLADALGVSRVPLRESMPRLEADGFINTMPHRSAIVTGWSPVRVMDVFDMRLAIEPEAVRLAPLAIRTGASTTRVESAIDDAEKMLPHSSRLELAERHANLYVLLVNVTGSGLMTATMRVLSNHLAWLFYLCPLQDPERAYEELREVIEAVQSGDGNVAKAMMIRHIALRKAHSVATIDAATSGIPSSWSESSKRRS